MTSNLAEQFKNGTTPSSIQKQIRAIIIPNGSAGWHLYDLTVTARSTLDDYFWAESTKEQVVAALEALDSDLNRE